MNDYLESLNEVKRLLDEEDAEEALTVPLAKSLVALSESLVGVLVNQQLEISFLRGVLGDVVEVGESFPKSERQEYVFTEAKHLLGVKA